MAEEKKKRGRPPKVDPAELAAGVDEYIASADPFPIVAEYARKSGITCEYLYQLASKEASEGRPALSQAIKRITDAKQVALETGAATGALNASMCIFSLKQLGWTDKQETTVTAEVKTELAIEDKREAFLERMQAQSHKD